MNNTKNIKIVIDHERGATKGQYNLHKLPVSITLIDMESRKEIETTEVTGLYDAMEDSRRLHERYNSRFDIEMYNEDEEFVDTVNL